MDIEEGQRTEKKEGTADDGEMLEFDLALAQCQDMGTSGRLLEPSRTDDYRFLIGYILFFWENVIVIVDRT
jgi:hypothetical protein